jgi:hypothetical protein
LNSPKTRATKILTGITDSISPMFPPLLGYADAAEVEASLGSVGRGSIALGVSEAIVGDFDGGVVRSDFRGIIGLARS